jgi:2,4-dichlorophenol 6-monooxygenase
MTSPPALPAETRVLVIGGGPVGLTASTLLSQHGISNVVVERRDETQRAPAAHVLRKRPMEVFERIGVAREIRQAAPGLSLDYIVWCASLAGREVGRLDLRVGLPKGQDVWTNCPQNVLEPILLERARREPASRILQGAECIAVEQDGDGVHAVVRSHNGSEQTVAATWMIAADGAGSPVRRMLDIPMLGPGPQGRFFMVHFEADLRPWIEARPGPIFWIMNPESPGTLIVHDPGKSHVFMTLRFDSEGEEKTIPGRLAAALGVPLDCRILSIDAWSPHVQVAERYREGRIFLAGDAAHRFPPTGGLGLNTGVLDVDYLVYQLARVEAGSADAGILDSYGAECRPAAQTNATESFENMVRLGAISAVLGTFSDLAGLEDRLASLSEEEREQLARAIELQRSHFVSDGRLPPDPREGAPSESRETPGALP